jgi:hypothetical protein
MGSMWDVTVGTYSARQYKSNETQEMYALTETNEPIEL